MNGFTVPQIFLNLIIAAKWTIILSIIAFCGWRDRWLSANADADLPE